MSSVFKAPKHKNASGPHRRVFELLQSIFSGFSVLENQSLEAEVNGRKTKLEVDFVIREMRVAVEVNGQQHYKFSSHFHKDANSLKQQQERDRVKAETIASLGFSLVTINDATLPNLTADKLAKMVLKATKET